MNIPIQVPPHESRGPLLAMVRDVAREMGLPVEEQPSAPMGEASSSVLWIDGVPLEGSAEPRWRVEALLLRALRPKHLLFMCVANSARSQLAEGLARALAPVNVRVSSAGSAPGSVRPQAVRVLQELGIDISHHRSKRVEDVNADSVDAVITLCADEVCPVFSRHVTRVHWALPDPAAVTGDEATVLNAFRDVRNELHRRLRVVFE